MQDVFNILGDTKLIPSDYGNSVTKPYREFIATSLLTLFATHKSILDAARKNEPETPSEYFTYIDIDIKDINSGLIAAQLAKWFKNTDVDFSLESAQFVIHLCLQNISKNNFPDYKIHLSFKVSNAKDIIPKFGQWDDSEDNRYSVDGKTIWQVNLVDVAGLFFEGFSCSEFVKIITNAEPLVVGNHNVSLAFDLEQKTDIIDGINVDLYAKKTGGYIEHPVLNAPDNATGELTIEIPIIHKETAGSNYHYFLANEFIAMYTNGLDILRDLMYSIDRECIAILRWNNNKILDDLYHIDYNPIMCGTYVTKSSLIYHYRKFLSEYISEVEPIYLISKEEDPMYRQGFGSEFKSFNDTLMSIAKTMDSLSIRNSTLDIAWGELYQLKCIITVKIGVWFDPINTSRSNAGEILTRTFKDNVDKITACIFGKAAPFLICAQFKDKCSLFDNNVNHLKIELKYEFNV